MSTQERVEQKELAALLIGTLNDSPEAYRSTVILVDVYEMDYLEAADVLNIPPGTVKNRLARARLQLKEKLAGNLRILNLVGASKLKYMTFT
jgi:RNA polymerase sigma-70 factor, ECF subfamily